MSEIDNSLQEIAKKCAYSTAVAVSLILRSLKNGYYKFHLSLDETEDSVLIFKDGDDVQYVIKTVALNEEFGGIEKHFMGAEGDLSFFKTACKYISLREKHGDIDKIVVFTNESWSDMITKPQIVATQFNAKHIFYTLLCPEKAPKLYNFLDRISKPQKGKFKLTYDQQYPVIVQHLKDQVKLLDENNSHQNLLNDKNLEYALSKIIYAVEQPSPLDILESVKSNLDQYFGLEDKTHKVFSAFLNEITKWMSNRSEILSETINYKCIMNFFKQMIKMGESAGIFGQLYQIGFAMLLFIRCVTLNFEKFSLESEVPEALKFDDIVFSEEKGQFTVVQLKHKTGKTKTINGKLLFPEDNNVDFSLPKYVKSYIDAQKEENYDGKVKTAYVYTNIPLDIETENPKDMEEPEDPKNSEIYKMKVKFEGLTDIKVREIFLDEKDILYLPEGNMKYYQFGDDDKLCQRMVDYFLKKDKEQTNKKSKNDKNVKPLTEEEENKAREALLENVKQALNNIVYAVNQPDKKTLFSIVDKEIEKYFKLESAEIIRNNLTIELVDWMFDKVPEKLSPIITHKAAQLFFEKNMKQITFDYIQPTSNFIGRKSELTELRRMLLANGVCAISQTVSISGLGGIGKTELVRKYIQINGKDYFNRIIWLNVENKDTIEIIIKRLAERLKVEMSEKESIETVIDKIVEFFCGFSVLFVLDNAVFVQNKEIEYVKYLRDQIRNLKANNMHVIITSRDQKYGGDCEHLEVDVLDLEDAIQLVMNQLENITKEDAELLVEKLDRFPLALQQAISYIKETNKNIDMFQDSFTIQNYIKELETKESVLKFEFSEDLGGKHSSTIFYTWNTTIDAIMKEGEIGRTAIKILCIMSHLDSTNINPYVFIPKFSNKMQIGSALNLLENYSMIKRDTKNLYSIHRMVQHVMKLKLREGFELKCLDTTDNAVVLTENSIIDDALNMYTCDALSNIDVSNEISHVRNIWIQSFKHPNLLEKYKYKTDILDKSLHHYSSIVYNSSAIKYLPRAGMNLQGNDGLTPLHEAVYCNNLDVAMHLIRNRCNVNLKDIYGDTPLHTAVRCNRADMVDLLVENGATVDERWQNQTPLHMAIENDDPYTMISLLEFNASVNAKNFGGDTPLHLAAEKGNVQKCKILFLYSPDVYQTNNNGYIPLHVACRSGHLNLVKLFIEEKKVEIDRKTLDGDSLLHLAVESNRTELIEWLLKLNFDINITNKVKDTPLHFAAKKGNVETCKILLNYNANINQTNDSGYIPLHWACRFGHLDLVKFFVEEKNVEIDLKTFDGDSLLHLAVKSNSTELIEWLLNLNHFDINITNNKNETPLHEAVRFNDIKNCEILLQYNANLYQTNMHVISPLHYAFQLKHFDLVKMFVEKKDVKMDIKTFDGDSLLHLAAKSNSTELVEWLLKLHSETNITNNIKRTPLHLAAEKGNVDTCKIFLRYGANVYQTDKYGYIPLHKACLEGHLDLVKFFIEEKDVKMDIKTLKGSSLLHLAASISQELVQWLVEMKCDIDSMNNAMQTPLNVAVKYNKPEIVEYLIKNGADTSLKNTENQTPLDVAIIMKHLKIIEILAAETGNVEICKILLHYNANINQTNDYVPLQVACLMGNLDLVKFFVEEKNVEIDRKTLDGDSLLHLAAKSNNTELIEWLLNLKNYFDVNITNNKNETPLHGAVRLNDVKNCEILLQYNANLNQTNMDVISPLHYAFQLKHFDLVKMFVEKKYVKMDIKTSNGGSLLHLAVDSQCTELIEWLLKLNFDINITNKVKDTPLHLASKKGNVETCKILLHYNANINQTNDNGYNPLHWACRLGHLDLVKFFVEEKNVETNLKTFDGDSLLHLAVKSNSTELIEWLLKMDSETNITNKVKQTPLHLAAETGIVETCKILLQYNANINQTNYNGYTPLHRACRLGRLDLVKFFVEEKNVEIDLKTFDGDSLLHLAATTSKELVQWLIKMNFDKNSTNNAMQTPLNVAVRYNKPEIVEYLIENGADTSLKNTENQTPLDVAIIMKHLKIIEILEKHLMKETDIDDNLNVVEPLACKDETISKIDSIEITDARNQPENLTTNDLRYNKLIEILQLSNEESNNLDIEQSPVTTTDLVLYDYPETRKTKHHYYRKPLTMARFKPNDITCSILIPNDNLDREQILAKLFYHNQKYTTQDWRVLELREAKELILRIDENSISPLKKQDMVLSYGKKVRVVANEIG